MKIIIFGASGQAGSGVLSACLKHPQVEKITSVVRKPSGIENDKLTEILHTDYLDYSGIDDRMRGHDACFWCLGISQTLVKTESEYRLITQEYTLAAADVLSKISDSMTFCFISGMGTDPTMKSRQMWARIKGETEINLAFYPFKKLYIFRPGFIHPVDKKSARMLYVKLVHPLYPLLNMLFPKYIVTNEELGRAMINTVLTQSDQAIFENTDIRKLV
ncbi:NAD(P)H-binding protein [Candidatus Latescibacterota bacterium]